MRDKEPGEKGSKYRSNEWDTSHHIISERMNWITSSRSKQMKWKLGPRGWSVEHNIKSSYTAGNAKQELLFYSQEGSSIIVSQDPLAGAGGLKVPLWYFPGGPVAKTLGSQCRGPRFDPWSGNVTPHTTTKGLIAATKNPASNDNKAQRSLMLQLRPSAAK